MHGYETLALEWRIVVVFLTVICFAIMLWLMPWHEEHFMHKLREAIRAQMRNRFTHR